MSYISSQISFASAIRDMEIQAAKLLCEQINKKIDFNLAYFRKEIQDLVEMSIKNSPEYSSLLHGELRGDFGLSEDDAEDVLYDLVQILRESVYIKFDRLKVLGGNIFGGVTVKLIKTDHNDILGIPAASYQSNGNDIDFLEWLLLRGDEIIIAGYHVVDSHSPASRSGQSIMVKRGSFRINPAYSGSRGNNFITRSIDNAEEIIFKYLQEILLA